MFNIEIKESEKLDIIYKIYNFYLTNSESKYFGVVIEYIISITPTIGDCMKSGIFDFIKGLIIFNRSWENLIKLTNLTDSYDSSVLHVYFKYVFFILPLKKQLKLLYKVLQLM